MGNVDFDAKKLEVLTDEELLNVSGGNGELPHAMVLARKDMCKNSYSKAECEQYDFCYWNGAEGTYHCKYRG
jgi:hypothetical protein